MTDVARGHQIRIAKATLRMSEIGARLMGGIDHATARDILRTEGWSDSRIKKWIER